MSTCIILTCSMARDIELFALLAESIDRFVPAHVQHRVVVPASDVAAFARFGNTRRQIVSQDDALPFKVRAFPKVLTRLSPFVGALRRPLYLAPGLNVVRGWVLQQILKIEQTRVLDADVVLHVDSDVFFVRLFDTDMVIPDGNPSFFRVAAEDLSPEHVRWTETSHGILGIESLKGQPAHYVENCIPWSPRIIRAMVDRIEDVHKTAWYKLLLRERSFSEYFIHGRFMDLLAGETALEARSRTICKTYWPDADGDISSYLAESARLTDHAAVAIQSTENISLSERRRIFNQISAGEAS